MKSQKDPDGIEGHKERERLQEQAKSFPKKRKFTGGNKRKLEWDLFNQSQTDLDRQYLKQICEFYKPGCNFGSCNQCKKKERSFYTKAMNQQKPVAGEIDPEYQNGKHRYCGNCPQSSLCRDPISHDVIKGSNQRTHIADMWQTGSSIGPQYLFYVNGIYRFLESSGICPLENKETIFDWTDNLAGII